MQLWISAFARVLVGGIVFFVASAALAIPLSVDISIDDTYVTTIDEVRLGCVDQGDGVSAICNASDLEYGLNEEYNQMSLGVTDLLIDIDPTVSGNITISNIDVVSHRFTLAFSLPITAIPGATLQGGAISGTLTDGLGDGATVSAPSGESIYTALIDAVALHFLLSDPHSDSTFTSGPVTLADFGTPIPSLLGGPANASIGIILDFELTPFDTVSFNSEFTVEPVPEPATGALLALGLVALAGRRSRR